MKIKTQLLIIGTIILSYCSIFSQSPQAFTYQAIVRDINGQVLANQEIAIKMTIVDDTLNGSIVYSEEHAGVTNDFGLFTLQVGHGVVIVGQFDTIKWSTGNFYLQTYLDPDAGGNYIFMATTQLLSVPFALHAKTAEYVDSSLYWKPNNTGIYYKDGDVVVGKNQIDSSAAFEIYSTRKGFLPPRLTTSVRDVIQNPAAGLLIFNVTDSVMEYYNGNCWLPVYMESCEACNFDMTLSSDSGIIDRVLVDSLSVEIAVTQNSGSQSISIVQLSNLPDGVDYSFDNPVINGSGVSNLSIQASIFAKSGTYPIIIQAFCGNSMRILSFILVIEPCIEVSISSSVENYDLQAVNNISSQPQCIIVTVENGVEIGSSSASLPSFTFGNLSSSSHVGMINNGYILGKGGDGGGGGSFLQFGSGGEDGGTALELSCKATIENNGYIFGGGGGGGSAGVQIIDIPYVGAIEIGAGGGGGSGSGLGGGSSLLSTFDPGTDGTSGTAGIAGEGGELNLPIEIPLSVGTLTLSPDIYGGNGGEYGKPGIQGSVQISAYISFIIGGDIQIPTPTLPSSFPDGGEAGMAIKTNGNTLIGLSLGNYNSTYIRGEVGQ